MEKLAVIVEKGPALKERAMEFETELINELKKNQITVVKNSDNILIVSIKEIRVVSLVIRTTSGGLTGRSLMEVEVTFQQNKKILTSFSIKSSELPHSICDCWSINKVFEVIARQIVAWLKE